MIFNYIKWKNFKSYGDYYTKIDFNNKSIRLIVGQNGNGKTTLVDAVIWGLYGRSLALVDEIVNRYTKKNCEVEISFSIKDVEFIITRYRNHEEHGNKLFLYKNKENITLRNALDTQNRISEIIQIPYHAMVSSIAFSSETYVSFLRSRVGDRLKVFDGILNLKLISIYYDLIKKEKKPIQDSFTEENNKKGKAESVLETLNQSLEDYKEKIKNTLLSLKERRENLDTEEKELNVKLISLCKINHSEEIDKNKEYKEITEHNSKINEDIESEKKGLVDINVVIENYNKVKEELEKIDEIDIVAELQKIDNYNETTNKNTEIDNKILALQNKIINIQHEQNRIEKIKEESKNLLIDINEIKNNINICPTCKQEVDVSINHDIIKEKEEKIIALSTELENLLSVIDDSKDSNKKINSEVEESLLLKETLPESSKHEESYLKGLEGRAGILEKKKVGLSQEIIEKEAFNENINNRIKSLQKKLISEDIEKSKFADDFLNDLKRQIESAEERLVDIKNEKNLINEKAKSSYDKKFVADAEDKTEKIKKAVIEVSKKIKKIENNNFHYDVLQNLFSNKEDGIKRFIINKMISLFNDRINFYLPLFFTDDIKINFSKDLTEEITIDKSIVSFNTFSSGEKTRLELAIAFSLFMLVKTFFSASINLLIFDEILDMNLDQEGVESVLNIIDNFSKENSVIVISHREEYKENFASQIIAEKIDKFSYLSMK